MQEGMLWYDNDRKASLKAKVKKAADYFKNKYGAQPDLCFVHPSMLLGGRKKQAGVELRPSVSMMPNHFWIGVGEAKYQNG